VRGIYNVGVTRGAKLNVVIPSRTLKHETSRNRAFAIATTALSVLATPRTAHADDASPSGRGATGGALLGSEIVVVAQALFGVRSVPAYVFGALGGAAAGGVGGYFLERGVSNGRVPTYLLAGGLALVIPTIVIALDRTRYVPTPASSPDAGGARGTASLLNVRGSVFAIGAPVPEVGPVFNAAQTKAFAVQNTGSEVRFPVVAVQF